MPDTMASRSTPTVLRPIRPLVIPVTLKVDASLIGLVADATAANVLGSTSIIFEEVGPRMFKLGLVGQELVDFAQRLAEKIGCGHQEVVARMHGYLGSPPTNRNDRKSNWRRPVRWGSGSVERHHLDLNRRWISPSALALSPHHRASWLCRLLPHCTETLERLVDHCGACGSRLGWWISRGITVCERCRQVVPPSGKPPLEDRWVKDYRHFADLLSTVDRTRHAARATLAEDLKGLDPIALTRLIIGLGRALGSGSSRHDVFVRHADDDTSIVEAASIGTSMTRDWPHALRASVEEMTGGVVPLVKRTELLARLRRSAGYRSTPSPHDAVLRAAVPELFERLHRALGFHAPVVLGSEAAKLIGIDIAEFQAIEQAKAIEGTPTIAGQRVYRQYKKSEIDRIARAWRGSCGASAFTFSMGVPEYAVEQLVCLDGLVRVTDLGVLALDANLRLTKLSVETLLEDLELKSRKDSPPDDAMTLHQLSRWTGGRMKPWARAILLIRSGEVSCWHRPDVATPPPRGSNLASRTLVRPADAQALFGDVFDERRYEGFPFTATIGQSEMLDLFNAEAPQLRELLANEEFAFEKDGHRSLRTDRNNALTLARRMMSPAELGLMLDQTSSYLWRMMERLPQIRKECIGWNRSDVHCHWNLIVGIVCQDAGTQRPRRVLATPMPEGHAELALHRLKSSLACTA